MPTFGGSFKNRWKFRRILWLDSKDSKNRSCNSTDSLLHIHLSWKIRFKTDACTCSQFLTEAMQWIKEVELVDSVDDLKNFVINTRYFNANI